MNLRFVCFLLLSSSRIIQYWTVWHSGPEAVSTPETCTWAAFEGRKSQLRTWNGKRRWETYRRKQLEVAASVPPAPLTAGCIQGQLWLQVQKDNICYHFSALAWIQQKTLYRGSQESWTTEGRESKKSEWFDCTHQRETKPLPIKGICGLEASRNIGWTEAVTAKTQIMDMSPVTLNIGLTWCLHGNVFSMQEAGTQN